VVDGEGTSSDRFAGHCDSEPSCWRESLLLAEAGPRRAVLVRCLPRLDGPLSTSCSIRLANPYSRHRSLTGRAAQIRRATSTPALSLGNIVSARTGRQLPDAVQEMSTGPSNLPCEVSVDDDYRLVTAIGLGT